VWWRAFVRSLNLDNDSVDAHYVMVRLFERGDELGDPTVVTAGDDLERLVVVQRRNGFAQRDGDVAVVHHTSEALDQRGQLDEALGALAGWGGRPAEQARAVLAAAPVARVISASLRWPTSLTKAASWANGEDAAAWRGRAAITVRCAIPRKGTPG
jgi:hypothetical protein